MDLGVSGHEQLGNSDQQQQQHQQQAQYQQQQSSALATTPLSPLRPASTGSAATMMQAASNYYSTPSPMIHAHHHDLASATKLAKLTTHSASGNGLGSAPGSKTGNDHKTSDQVVTDQAREILRQAVVTAATESNKAAAVANNNNNNNNNNNSNNNNNIVVKPSSKPGAVRYRECLKNHAAGIGGHAVDGCGEFMPGSDDGDGDALRCAACDCHRNFHRREVEGECDCKRKLSKGMGIATPQHGATLAAPAVTTLALTGGGGGQMTPLTMAAAMSAGGPTDSDDQDDGPGHIVTSGGLMMSMRSPSAIKKRFRTKFTTEQKDKMLAFAEKVGWRIQKHDEAAVHEFCVSVGVKRHVLKVWMHNNKHTMGKKP